MFCSCNENFCPPPEQCKCCCAKTNVKGKFGVAYLVDTPNRKCDPCGWEVEFNDTPSQVDYNCNRMMKWVTCPPLGGCQNNSTKVCCCSDAAEGFLSGQDATCSCKPKARNRCCCAKQEETSCSCGNQKQHCRKPNKPKCSCCKASDGQKKYFESIKKCKGCCCCKSPPKETSCCVKKDKRQCCMCTQKSQSPQSCCGDSDSDSLDSSCDNLNKKCCACECGSVADKKTKKKNAVKSPSMKSKDSRKVNTQTSKNFPSSNRPGEKPKFTDRTPYTITNNPINKKEPDKSPALNNVPRPEDVSPTFKEIKAMLEKSPILNQPNIKPVPPQQTNTQPEAPPILDQADVKPISSEKTTGSPSVNVKTEPPITEKPSPVNETNINAEPSPKVVESPILNEIQSIPSQKEQELPILNEEETNIIDYDNENKDVPKTPDQPEGESIISKSPTPKPTLLQKIKRRHKQESDLIRTNEENKPERNIPFIKESKPAIKKLNKKQLLSDIKKKHKKQREAVSENVP